MKHGVGDKLEFMYRIESSSSEVDAKSFRRQIYKTYFFFFLDLAVLVTCLVALIKMYEDWLECTFNFNAWAICIVILSLFSLLLNFATVYFLFRHNRQE